MNMPGLVLLVEILDAGNLSKAAKTLKLSRANVSYHLNQLERSIGVQLVRRTTRQLEPTEIGQRLYKHGRVIRDELSAAKEAVASLSKGLHGAVRLSVPTGFGQLVMSKWLIEFKQMYPDINLELVFDNRIDDLLRDEVDVAIRVMSEPPPTMVARELAPVRYSACASVAFAKRHRLPADPKELMSLPVITSSVIGREVRVSAYQGNEKLEVILQPTLASENFQFLLEALLADLGIGLVPDYVVSKEVEEGRVVKVLNDWRLSIFGTKMYLLRMPERYQTLATRTLIDFILLKAKNWHDAMIHI